MTNALNRLGWIALALVALMLAPAPSGSSAAFTGASQAWADDDDDDDDDDRGSRRGGSRATGRDGNGPGLFRLFRQRVQPSRRAAPARRAAAPRPVRVPDELVATGLDDATLARLTAASFTLRERSPGGPDAPVRLGVPAGRGLDAALAEVREAAPTAIADFNHYYRSEQADCAGGHCAGHQLIGWPGAAPGRATCGPVPPIGMVDTAINPDHEAFAPGQIVMAGRQAADLPGSGRQHGTAIAAILAGSSDSRAHGLLPGVPLVAVDVFHRGKGGDDRADAFALVTGIAVLAERDVGVINLSLAGPPNEVLRHTVERIEDAGVVLVAAAGNAGAKSQPLYPAAYDTVVAVTAVDRNSRIYRRAVQGPHLDLAAPGVGVWTAASIKGARSKTGTSFAAPFVTAAVALMKAERPQSSPAEIRAELFERATDLGTAGHDPVFGWGLLDASGLCARKS